MTEPPDDRQQPKRSRRRLAYAIAAALIVIALLVAPRYAKQVVTVDQTHRWADDVPPHREIVWQPATPLPADETGTPFTDSMIRPHFSDDGNVMHFTRRTERGDCDIMRAQRIGDRWGDAEPIEVLNSNANDIGPVIRADGAALYFYSDREGGSGGMDLYSATRRGDQWGKPENLGTRINSPAHEYDPAISPDGTTLYFSSNRSDAMHRRMQAPSHDPHTDWGTTLRADLGHRTFDLYVAESDREGEPWRNAVPIDNLNTERFNEGSPFVSADGAFLLFASDRPTSGAGPVQYDLYRWRLDRASDPPENLGPGINTNANEVEPWLSDDGFRIAFSRGGDPQSRYEIYQSAAKEIYRERQWDASRWSTFSGAVDGLARRLAVGLPWILLFAVLFFALYWLLRQVTSGRLTLPSFLLAAFLIHLLMVTSSFFVFFQKELSDQLRKMFDEETIVASEVLLPSSAESDDQQTAFDQVAELQVPEAVPPADIARQVVSSDAPTLQPVDIRKPMQTRLTRDVPTDVIAAGMPAPQTTPDPMRRNEIVRRSHAPTLSATPQIEMADTVSVQSPAAGAAPRIEPDLASPQFEPKQAEVSPAAVDRERVASKPEFATPLRPPDTIAIVSNAAPLQIARAPLPTASMKADVTNVPIETIAVAESPSETPPANIDIRLPRDPRQPSVAQPAPAVVVIENRGVPEPAIAEILANPLVGNESMPMTAASSLPALLPRSSATPRPAVRQQGVANLSPLATPKSTPIENALPRLEPPKLTRQRKDRSATNFDPVDLQRKVVPNMGLPTDSLALARETGITSTSVDPSLNASSGLPERRVMRAADIYADATVHLRSLLQRRNLDASTKSEVIKQFGGNDETLVAIKSGLNWIEQHQHSDGHWGLHNFHENCKGHARCKGNGSSRSDTAGTGLALLPFLGDGNTHRAGPHKDLVSRGITWIVSHQKPDGDLFTGGQDIAWMYSHGIATIALCECYGMSDDAALRGPAQRAIDFIVNAQDPKTGGWRYKPRDNADTSVVGWQVMALKSGQMAELNVPQKTLDEAERWLEKVAGKGGRKGQFAYQPGRFSVTMTAEAMLCLEYLGSKRDAEPLRHGADFLLKHLPKKNRESSYFLYYGTQAMFHLQGEHWQSWNAALHPLLIETQHKKGPLAGSWDARDNWERSGGRVYSTSLRLLMLEVYYRHLPLYRVIE